MTHEEEAFYVTIQDIERRFLNADNLYDRFKVLQETLSWVECLRELSKHKDEEIKRLNTSIKGYDLHEYE